MNTKFDKNILKDAHAHSFLNKEELLKSDECGCFSCLKVFKPSEIKHWHYESERGGYTGFCPFCDVDTLIGSESGYPIKNEFLSAMQGKWCPTDEQISSGEIEVIEVSSTSELMELLKKRSID